MNECGVVNGTLRVVKPHPEFRIFLAMDAQFGEISRAMRNRCIEIALLPCQDQLALFPMDVVTSMQSVSPDVRFPLSLISHVMELHTRQSRGANYDRKLNLSWRHLVNWSQLTRAFIDHGLSLQDAAAIATREIYSTELHFDFHSRESVHEMVQPELYVPSYLLVRDAHTAMHRWHQRWAVYLKLLQYRCRSVSSPKTDAAATTTTNVDLCLPWIHFLTNGSRRGNPKQQHDNGNNDDDNDEWPQQMVLHNKHVWATCVQIGLQLEIDPSRLCIAETLLPYAIETASSSQQVNHPFLDRPKAHTSARLHPYECWLAQEPLLQSMRNALASAVESAVAPLNWPWLQLHGIIVNSTLLETLQAQSKHASVWVPVHAILQSLAMVCHVLKYTLKFHTIFCLL